VLVLLLHESVRNFSSVNRGRWRFFTTCTGSPSFHTNSRSSVVQPSVMKAMAPLPDYAGFQGDVYGIKPCQSADVLEEQVASIFRVKIIQVFLAICFLLVSCVACLALMWRRYVPPTRQLTLNRLHQGCPTRRPRAPWRPRYTFLAPDFTLPALTLIRI
jgi:hypothetical protein